jgi:hypothetical protein
LAEKIKARQERFGASTAAAAKEDDKPKVVTNPGVNSVVLDEKLKKRSERFGLANA